MIRGTHTHTHSRTHSTKHTPFTCMYALTYIYMDSTYAYSGGVCPLLVSYLRRHETHAGVLEHGMAAMALLAKGDARHALNRAGAQAVVLSCLRRNFAHTFLTECGLNTISWLGNKKTTTNADQSAWYAEAYALVFRCLCRHILQPNVVERGLRAICNWTTSPGGLNVVMRNFSTLAVCALLVSCIRRHEAHAGVVEQGLATIGVFARDQYCHLVRKYLVDTGACAVVLACLRRYEADARVVEKGLLAVRNLALYSEARKRLTALGACAVLMSCLSRGASHLATPWGREQLLFAVGNLADGNDEAREQFESGGAAAMIQAAFTNMHRFEIPRFLISGDGEFALSTYTSKVRTKGWLRRRSKWFKVARARFFVLKGHTLSAYLKEPKSLSDFRRPKDFITITLGVIC